MDKLARYPKQIGPGLRPESQGMMRRVVHLDRLDRFLNRGGYLRRQYFLLLHPQMIRNASWSCVNPCVKMVPECAKAYQNRKRLAKEYDSDINSFQ